MYFFLALSKVDELMVIGMNLLSGTTWKGAKLRIGEAKPDFRERYEIHTYLNLPINGLILSLIGLNVRARHPQMIDKQKGVAWKEALKAFTPPRCPSSLPRMSPRDLAGALHLWVGSFIR